MKFSLAAAALALTLAGAAHAQTVVPVSATASSSYPGYDASYAIDQGAGSDVTDWASNGGGAASYLDLDLGAAYLLSSATVTDRTTSGGPNGTFYGGLFDYTTSFSLSYYTDASFSGSPTATYTFARPTPGATSSPSDFALTASLAPAQKAEFVRYTVLATNGVNPGLSDIKFTGSVPEPATWAMMLLGFGMIGFGLRHRRNSSKVNFA